MIRNKINTLTLTLILTGLMYTQSASSQTVDNDFKLRSELSINKDLTKKLKLSIIPEIRWDNSLNPDKYLLESQLTYKPVKGLALEGAYRFITNPRDTKSTEFMHRFALEATYGTKIKRWEPSVRLKYTNYTEDASSGDFLRYRAKLEYDLPNSKITPSLGVEGFYDISEKNVYKYRYSMGVDYKINKHNSVGIGYMLDYYMQEYQNNHILNLKYKYKF